MPDDVAIEKVQVLEKLGAKVERVRPGEWRSRTGAKRCKRVPIRADCL